MSTTKKEIMTIVPALAEASCIKWCLQLGKDQKLEDIIVQSDSLVVIECIKGSNTIATIDHIVSYCTLLMKEFKMDDNSNSLSSSVD